MSIHEASTRVAHVVGNIGETTVAADMAYLPSGFETIKAAIVDLGKKKKEWGITVLENEKDYTITFEDALRIKVPKEHWQEFSGILDGDLQKTVNLSRNIREAFDEEMEELWKTLSVELIDMYKKPPFDALDKDINNWRARFGVQSYKTPNTVVIKYESKNRDIKRLLHKLKTKLYLKGDRGEIELMLDAIQNKSPMNAFEGFSGYDFLYGCRIQSRYYGESMTFECGIDMAYVTTESIYIQSQEIIDALSDLKTIKIVRNVVFPTGGSFNRSFFRTLKKEIMSVEYQEPEPETEDEDETIT